MKDYADLSREEREEAVRGMRRMRLRGASLKEISERYRVGSVVIVDRYTMRRAAAEELCEELAALRAEEEKTDTSS